jgi:hypothetical protein
MGREDPSHIQSYHQLCFLSNSVGFIALRFVVAPLLPCLPRPVVGDIARQRLRGNGNGTKARHSGRAFSFGEAHGAWYVL